MKSLLTIIGWFLWHLSNNSLRKKWEATFKLIHRYKLKAGLKFMGNQVTIHPDVYIRNPERLSIGDKSNINHGSELYCAGGIEIGNNTMLAYRVTVFSDTRTYKGKEPLKSRTDRILKKTTIGNDVWIGANAIILGGITVGNHAVVAAGAVVTKNVSEWDIVGGNPAKVIGNRITT